jgi:hypothetical protein
MLEAHVLPAVFTYLAAYDARFCDPDRSQARLLALLDRMVVENPRRLAEAQGRAVADFGRADTATERRHLALAVDRLIVLAFWRTNSPVDGEAWQQSELRLLENMLPAGRLH